MHSAGILLFRRRDGEFEFFLVHPGGPFFARRDRGVWSIPKGEIEPGEEPYDVARREFEEETGQPLESCATGEPIPLGTVRQAAGKLVEAWALEGDWPPGVVFASNTFELEWPRGSGRRQAFPEVDRGEFLSLAQAREALNPAQVAFLERLSERLSGRPV